MPKTFKDQNLLKIVNQPKQNLRYSQESKTYY